MIGSIETLIQMAHENKCSIGHAMIQYEAKTKQISEKEVVEKMKHNWHVMKESVRTGLEEPKRSKGGLIGGEAKTLHDYCAVQPNLLSGRNIMEAVSYSLAVAEVNATMGRIVACPTAGSCGIVPGVLKKIQELDNLSDEQIAEALMTCAGVGMVIAHRASVSGAVGGCQAECGAASAMAAAAAVELRGGTPEQAGEACAMVIKNVMGLACDPVAGLVEVPCAKRNALGASLAMVMADMALSGVKSVIPVDEVITAMGAVGRSLPESLRETARGGLAVTPTGLALNKKIFGE
ncbi:MAG: L-serine ammonia-lyase, iron-sulfur-dependent, subunit alpha [Peptococcaceae bacterium]|jgi:L-serine dehydratase|nr:L-serine ammonia-lyase, iron-sulfur-dependent, subunit alpha [Peptococcaceae bacterium]